MTTKETPFIATLAGLPPDLEPPPPDSPRGRIIASARTLFAQNGFAATSIRTIANGASVNLAMVNYYYSTKKLLYQRVIIGELINSFRIIQHDLPAELSPDKIILRLPLAIANMLRNNPIWAQLIRRELAEGAPNFKIILEQLGEYGPTGLRDVIISTFQKASNQGDLKQIEPLDVIPFLIALGYGMVLLDPILSVVSGKSVSDDSAWTSRMEAMQVILYDGLRNKTGETEQ